MELCYEGRVGRLGVYYRVRLYTVDRGECERLLREASGASSIEEGLDLAKQVVAMHRGCRVLSENPLVLETVDGSLRVEATPESPMAHVLHGRIVALIKEKCASAKDTPLNGPGASPP